MGSPRFDVVICFWQCDKKNQGWREGPPVTVLCQSLRSAGRAFTLRLNQFERKKNTALPCCPPASHSNIGRLSPTIRQVDLDPTLALHFQVGDSSECPQERDEISLLLQR